MPSCVNHVSGTFCKLSVDNYKGIPILGVLFCLVSSEDSMRTSVRGEEGEARRPAERSEAILPVARPSG